MHEGYGTVVSHQTRSSLARNISLVPRQYYYSLHLGLEELAHEPAVSKTTHQKIVIKKKLIHCWYTKIRCQPTELPLHLIVYVIPSSRQDMRLESE